MEDCVDIADPVFPSDVVTAAVVDTVAAEEDDEVRLEVDTAVVVLLLIRVSVLANDLEDVAVVTAEPDRENVPVPLPVCDCIVTTKGSITKLSLPGCSEIFRVEMEAFTSAISVVVALTLSAAAALRRSARTTASGGVCKVALEHSSLRE